MLEEVVSEESGVTTNVAGTGQGGRSHVDEHTHLSWPLPCSGDCNGVMNHITCITKAHAAVLIRINSTEGWDLMICDFRSQNNCGMLQC